MSNTPRARRTQAERRAESRRAVLDAATELFGRQGYAGTSLEDIAERLGISTEETKSSYAGLLLPDLAENKNMLFGAPPPLLASMNRLAEKMRTAHLLKKNEDYRTVFAPQHVLELYP